MLVYNNIDFISKEILSTLKSKQKKIFPFVEYLQRTIPCLIKQINIDKYEVELVVDKKHLSLILFFLKKHTLTQYHTLTDIIGADYPGKKERFEVTYHLLSTDFGSRLRVVTYTDETTPLDTVTHIYPVADWQEREVYDMFGVFFDGHPDLRRILTDYGFESHPLRKDFPLTGFYELFYDESEKRIARRKVSLPQEYRNFKFNNPWKDKKTGKVA